MNSNLIEKLRSLPTMVNFLPTEKGYFYSLLPGGLPQFGLVEVSGAPGSGKTEAVLRFLKENEQLQIAWIEREFTIFPSALVEYGIDLNRILFIDLASPSLKQTPLWCASQILKSHLFQVLILSQIQLGELELRRLQILAKQSNSLVLLIQSRPLQHRNWSFSLQIAVHRSEPGAPTITVLKSRNSLLWTTGKE